ncbi:MAG: RNA polymerase sigma-70 factor [Bacteroidota bacterium]
MAKERLDNFLISELKSGNARAFEKIFNDYYSSLCRFSFSIVHDQDIARSLVQNVFVKLWESRQQLEKIISLPSYLAAMVKNESINHVKWQNRQLRLQDNRELAGIEIQDTTHILEYEIAEKLAIALNLLPERCRTAFEFSRFDNLSNKEIAEKMEISVKGVEALITRALKLLREELSEFLPSAKNKKLPGNLLFLLIRKFSGNHY